MRNLEAFFCALGKKFEGLRPPDDREQYFDTVQENAKATREKVLKYLMIRRTRTEIEKYYGEDMKPKGLKFPEVEDPNRCSTSSTRSRTRSSTRPSGSLTSDFKYARYKPLTYYEGEGRAARCRASATWPSS